MFLCASVSATMLDHFLKKILHTNEESENVDIEKEITAPILYIQR